MTVMTDAYNKLVNEDNLAGYGDPLYDQFKDQALFLAVEKRDRPLMCYLIGKGASLEVFDERDVTILDFCLERGFSIYPMPRPSWVDKDVWYSVGIRMFRQILSRPNTANQLGEILRNVPMDKLVPTFIEHIGEALDSLETTVADDDERAAVGNEVMSWFGAWVSGGFFRAIELSDEPPG